MEADIYALQNVRTHESIMEEPLLEDLCAVTTNDSITGFPNALPSDNPARPSSLLLLPPELQHQILSHLDTFEDLLSTLLICRSFYPVAKHARDTRRFDYSLGYVCSHDSLDTSSNTAHPLTESHRVSTTSKLQSDIRQLARRPSDVNERHWGVAPALGGDVWHWWARLTIPDVMNLRRRYVFKTVRRRRISGVVEWPEPECGDVRIPYTVEGFGFRVARAVVAG